MVFILYWMKCIIYTSIDILHKPTPAQAFSNIRNVPKSVDVTFAKKLVPFRFDCQGMGRSSITVMHQLRLPLHPGCE